MRQGLLTACLMLWAWPAFAQVSHGSTRESHTGTTGSASEASFTIASFDWGTPEGGFVCTFQLAAGAHIATAVDWGGIAGTAVATGLATTTAGDEDGSTQLWSFPSIPSGTSTITITRTNNATVLYAIAHSDEASSAASVYEPGIVLASGQISHGEDAVDDGSPGTDSARHTCNYSGIGAVPSAGANSTTTLSIDFGAITAAVYMETTPGQGSRNVGPASGTTDDVANVSFAMIQTPAAGTNCGDGLLIGVNRCR